MRDSLLTATYMCIAFGVVWIDSLFYFFNSFLCLFLMNYLPCGYNQWILVFIKNFNHYGPYSLCWLVHSPKERDALTAVTLRNRSYLIATSPDRPACDSGIHLIASFAPLPLSHQLSFLSTSITLSFPSIYFYFSHSVRLSIFFSN